MRGIARLAAGALVALVVTPAAAQSVWTAPDDMTFASYAMLPAPDRGTPVTGGVLLCDAQVWTLSLALQPGETIEGANGRATLTARSQPFSVSSSSGNATIDLHVPVQALEPMKAGTRLELAFEGAERPVRFPLTGSRRAITAVEGACSPRQLPVENKVELIAASPHLETGRRLRAGDIRDFVVSTNILPDLRVARLDLDGGRQLLFTEICGSSWYYGVSGCNVAGHARLSPDDAGDPDLEGWEVVFESEGVHLYTEPDEQRDGWPNLIAIPLKPGFEDKLWTWNGQRYVVRGAIQAELRAGK